MDYYITDNAYEAMSYACHTWGKAVGAFGATAGVIDGTADLSSAVYDLPGEIDSGFGDEHSGQFNARIQNLIAFYDEMLDAFGLNLNHEQ